MFWLEVAVLSGLFQLLLGAIDSDCVKYCNKSKLCEEDCLAKYGISPEQKMCTMIGDPSITPCDCNANPPKALKFRNECEEYCNKDCDKFFFACGNCPEHDKCSKIGSICDCDANPPKPKERAAPSTAAAAKAGIVAGSVIGGLILLAFVAT